MAKGNLNREDYKTAIPQLSAKLNQILSENVLFNKQVVTLQKQAAQNSQDFAYFRQLTAGYIEAIAGDFDYLSSHEAYFEHVTAEIIDSDEINSNFLHTTFANIDHADIDVSAIGTLFNEVGLIDSATIVHGHITGFLDAVQINAASITAGTLITNRLLLSGTAQGNTSILYELNNLGQLTSQNVDSLDGYVLTPRTINADRIVAGSITANEIAANTITASQIAANTITANQIAASTITANEIAAGTITATQIAANTITANKIAARTITANEIAANTITASQIASGTITATELSVANINVGIFDQGTHRSITVDSNYPKSYTYMTAAGYVGLMNDSWSNITGIGGGTWLVGDLVSIPFTISDRNDAQAYMVCRIKSYSGTTLIADNLAIVTDPEASQYMSFDPQNGLRVYGGNKDSASYNKSYVQIQSTGIDIVSDEKSLASFGKEARLGQKDDYHTIIGNNSFGITDANDDIMFSVDSTGEIRNTKVIMFSVSADDTTESTTGAKTRTVYDQTGKEYDLDTTYTLYAGGRTATYTPRTDGSVVTMSVPYKAGIGLPAQGYERTHTIKFTFTLYSTHAVLSKVEDTTPNYEYQWTANNYSYTYPRITINGTQGIAVSTAIINGREYQLEDLFGTSNDVLSLGSCVCVAVLSSSSTYIAFSIPTGRVLPNGATIERITCDMIARAGYSEGTGRYIVKKTNGGTDAANLDSDNSSSFYNAYNMNKTITPSMWAMSIQGRTNIRVTIEGDRSYFFSGSEDISNGINNHPVVLDLRNIKIYLSNL